MPSNRIGRINEEIQREMSSLIRTVKDPRVVDAGMVSVTAVETTPDLKYAKIYVSVLDKSASAQVLKGLKSASGYLRRELGRALNLRNTPELSFVRDDSIDKGAHILDMLRNPEVVKPANPANAHIILDEED
ncbi:MAG: 30S ribosome-binding factor RbfA [Clostridiales bacterium]|nr:30S ribosome-binding factor RbfA [Clostridiales bacterium]